VKEALVGAREEGKGEHQEIPLLQKGRKRPLERCHMVNVLVIERRIWIKLCLARD
jgi:hypothetical protein